MAVCFYMEQCITPCFYNSEDDPMVALYVPKWQHRRDFIKRLREFRLPTFEHIGDHAEIEEENYYPLWSTVHLAPHVNHSRLDLDGIEKTILNRVKRLIAVEGKISDLILEVRHKRG
jgi:hemerythrin superfamily protein